MVAGLYTRAADPPVSSVKGHRSDPSPSAMPRGTFPDNKMTFQLQAPRNMGVGVQLGIFKQPERQPYRAVAAERAGNFARGRGAFMHYCHMQQSAKMLIPSLPTQSRVDELQRVHANAKNHELQRTLTLESLQQNERRRQSRLRQAKTLLQTKPLAREVSQKLQASCSLPNLEEPCGEHSQILQLLNRRVDVNRLKKCRSQLAQQQQAEVVKQAVVETPELKELVEDIKRFEGDHLPDLVLETVVDWKNSTTISWQHDPNGTTISWAHDP